MNTDKLIDSSSGAWITSKTDSGQNITLGGNMKVVLIYSGGLDSTVLLYHLIESGYEVKCLCFDYGQRHDREIESAIRNCVHLEIPYEEVHMPELARILKGSSQTSDDVPVPHGHYEEESMRKTVVPNRNMIMLSIAIGHAISLDYTHVAYAAHSGDHFIYPDCRPQFITAMRKVACICDDKVLVDLFVPFENMNKTQIVKLGKSLHVPFEKTWTCYEGKDKACGKCGSCRERLEAFHLTGMEDPLEYI